MTNMKECRVTLFCYLFSCFYFFFAFPLVFIRRFRQFIAVSGNELPVAIFDQLTGVGGMNFFPEVHSVQGWGGCTAIQEV